MLVLVLGEVWDGEIEPVTFETLGAAERIGDVCVAVMGCGIERAAEELAYYADTVYRVDGEEFRNFHPELWIEAMEEICRNVKPDAVIIPHTLMGMDVAANLAYRLQTQLTTDCVDLKVDDEGFLLRYKPVFGGNAVAVIRCRDMPQMVTVRPKCFEKPDRKPQKGRITDFRVEVKETRVKIKEIVKEEVVRLDKADAIVSGGRGLGDEEGFALLRELADVLKAFKFRSVEIGASRPAVDAGWIEKYRQVGLTGAKVSPELYIAVGISGAMQHVAGIMRAKKIVAINTDPKAPIFSFADYGVVGDYRKVLPALIGKLKELRRRG